MTTKKDAVALRLWQKVRRTPGCWEWLGSRDKKGYGRLSLNRRPALAHRVAWELERGPIQDGLCVLHRCDNPRCVRPEHLFLGTRLDNNRDMFAKGRNHTPPRKRLCARGHERTPENLRGRACRICSRLNLQAWRDDNREHVRARERATYHADIEKARRVGREKSRLRTKKKQLESPHAAE